MAPTKSQGDRLIAIGEAAARLGLSVDTLRDWDGLEDSPLRSDQRSAGRHRRYLESAVEQLVADRRARA